MSAKTNKAVELSLTVTLVIVLLWFILAVGIPHAKKRYHIWNSYSDLETRVEVLEYKVKSLENARAR